MMSDKPVLFVSFRPLERAENIRAIYDAYQGRKEHILSTDPDYVSKVLSGRYDIMVTDDFPTVTPGECIMIWHGIQGGKHIGLDQHGSPYYRRELIRNITYIISASVDAIPMWQQCTGAEAYQVCALGMPRTDAYIGKKKGDGHTFLADKTSYLFVPTFRDNGETRFPTIDWDYIDNTLTDDELFVIKAHPWQIYQGKIKQIKIKHKPYKHIRVVEESEPSAPYLYDADVVITDYSSIMFDAYLLNKPVVLFEKNQGYTKTRGMYMKYPDEYCTWYAVDEAQLIELTHSALHTGLLETERNCVKTVAGACDGNACKRICFLIDMMKGDIVWKSP